MLACALARLRACVRFVGVIMVVVIVLVVVVIIAVAVAAAVAAAATSRLRQRNGTRAAQQKKPWSTTASGTSLKTATTNE